MINITAVIVDRANYGRLKPLLSAFDNDKDFNLSVICCGSTVLKRFHKPAIDIESEFFVTNYIYNEVEGSNEISTVNSMAILMPQLAIALQQTKPSYVLIIGDRFEALAVATVVSMMKLCLIHVQGGEQSGNVDNSIRHAITKLAHYHLPATQLAAKTLCNMGEREETILGIGCPTADLVKKVKRDRSVVNKILCIYHPEDGINNKIVVSELLMSLARLNRNVIMLWPNIDANADGINKIIRRYIAINNPEWLIMQVNYTPEQYLSILAGVKCCVGNSSSFVRDASFFGTPVVLLGNRQIGRVKTNNIKWFRGYDFSDLHLVIKKHMANDFIPSEYYGVHGVSKLFVSRLKMRQPYFLKV